MVQKLLSNPGVAKLALNLWPPFWGSGIKIKRLSKDFTHCEVALRFSWWNKNANRSQFGGSMFAMTDPIYPLMLMAILGSRYHIWDKSAQIDFIKPGMGKLYARFHIEERFVREVRMATEAGEKFNPKMVCEVVDEQGEVVARIERTLYIRLKRRFRPAQEEAA